VKLLRIANSPLYGTRVEITSVQQAIITLGLSRLTNMVLGISIFSKFMAKSNKTITPYLERFWWHVASNSMVAKSFAVKTNCFYKENEFIGGLLHDIGKLALLQYDSEKFFQTLELMKQENISDLEAESKIFGCDHTEVGYQIAVLWQLPKTLQQIIRYHHAPEQAPENVALIATVRVTDLLCEIWGAGFYEGITSLSIDETPAWKTLAELTPKLNDLDIVLFTYELEADLRNAETFLDLISKGT
jgi:putative nucleotidyltransferase with HDIG domain